MKFFRKHKILSFAVISFFTLSGVNFYMIFELVKVIRNNVKKEPVHFCVKYALH